MLTLVHGSDLHFGPPHDPEVAEGFLHATETLEPDLIVLSGDFTQRAKISEYEEAKRYIDLLPGVPKVLTPGNHDVPLYRVFERLLTPHRNYRRYVQENLDTVTQISGLTVVALDSTAPWSAIVNGRITRRQMDFARQAFWEAPVGDLKIAVTHHHLAPAPDYERDHPLPRAKAILGQFHGMGVELVLGGHLHRSYIANSLDVCPGLSDERGLVLVQCGTTTSRRGRARERARNSFNVVRVHRTRFEVTHCLYLRDRRRFSPVSVHTFPRAPHLWVIPESTPSEAPTKRSRVTVGADEE
jgi:3',5'-cyclic AMP phosphodiesterase CpdA